jgi:hypothetical protein
MVACPFFQIINAYSWSDLEGKRFVYSLPGMRPLFEFKQGKQKGRGGAGKGLSL